jgi:hypothetical protein
MLRDERARGKHSHFDGNGLALKGTRAVIQSSNAGTGGVE